MSGFSGGNGAMGDLIRNVQSQQQGQRAQMGQTPATAPPGGGGPGEPTQGGAYGQQGMYNTLATDMSRGRMGNFGFNGGMFGYQPFGNPYQQQSPFSRLFGDRPGGFSGGFRGGMGGGYAGQGPFAQPTQPPTMGDYTPRQRFAGAASSLLGNFNPTQGEGYSNMYASPAQPRQGHDGFLNSMYQQIGHPGLRNRMQRGYGADYSEGSYNAVPNMMGGGMMGNHQYTGGMGGYGKPQPMMGGGFGGGFGRRAMY